jgi:hypothetical protein
LGAGRGRRGGGGGCAGEGYIYVCAVAGEREESNTAEDYGNCAVSKRVAWKRRTLAGG